MDVHKSLNRVLQDCEKRPRLSAVVEFHRMTRVGDAEVRYCLQFYGRPRDVARAALKEDIIKTAKEKKLAELSEQTRKVEQADKFAQDTWMELIKNWSEELTPSKV